ncbi:MAG: alpha/beta fold hydrolase [Chloroflexota bacterium]|nr:MAG: alpha/beta fold hydrolase [Chloroflexota bacterium]
MDRETHRPAGGERVPVPGISCLSDADLTSTTLAPRLSAPISGGGVRESMIGQAPFRAAEKSGVRAGLAEPVSIRTRDNVLLHGALFEPSGPTTTAVLLVHGAWGNFYTGPGRFLPAALARAGVACLTLNLRGHDYGTVIDREPSIGMMRDQFEDCPEDITAGLDFLCERGYHRLVLAGHSLGAAKVGYSQLVEPHPAVRALILCSLATLMSESAEFYLDMPYDTVVQDVTRLVESGQGEQILILRHDGPMPVVVTPRTFLSLWGPEPANDMRKYIGQLRLPILFVTCAGDIPSYQERTRALFELADQAEPRDLVILPRGDHYLFGAEEPFQASVLDWLNKLGLH